MVQTLTRPILHIHTTSLRDHPLPPLATALGAPLSRFYSGHIEPIGQLQKCHLQVLLRFPGLPEQPLLPKIELCNLNMQNLQHVLHQN